MTLGNLAKSVAMGLAVVGFASASAWANWLYVPFEGNLAFRLYVSSDHIKKFGTVRKLWVLQDWANPISLPDMHPFTSEEMLWQIDCAEDTVDELDQVHFSGHIAQGNIVVGAGFEPHRYNVSPGSFWEAIENAVCK